MCFKGESSSGLEKAHHSADVDGRLLRIFLGRDVGHVRFEREVRRDGRLRATRRDSAQRLQKHGGQPGVGVVPRPDETAVRSATWSAMVVALRSVRKPMVREK